MLAMRMDQEYDHRHHQKMWMNPPSVYELTIPSSHSTNRITKTVQSISHLVVFDSINESNPGLKTLL